MVRGNTDLSNYEYDNHLASKSRTSRTAKRELKQRHSERKNAHSSDGTGWHFGLGDKPIKVERKEDLRRVLDQHGLMLSTDVKKDLHMKKGMA